MAARYSQGAAGLSWVHAMRAQVHHALCCGCQCILWCCIAAAEAATIKRRGRRAGERRQRALPRPRGAAGCRRALAGRLARLWSCTPHAHSPRTTAAAGCRVVHAASCAARYHPHPTHLCQNGWRWLQGGHPAQQPIGASHGRVVPQPDEVVQGQALDAGASEAPQLSISIREEVPLFHDAKRAQRLGAARTVPDRQVGAGSHSAGECHELRQARGSGVPVAPPQLVDQELGCLLLEADQLVRDAMLGQRPATLGVGRTRALLASRMAALHVVQVFLAPVVPRGRGAQNGRAPLRGRLWQPILGHATLPEHLEIGLKAAFPALSAVAAANAGLARPLVVHCGASPAADRMLQMLQMLFKGSTCTRSEQLPCSICSIMRASLWLFGCGPQALAAFAAL